MMGAGRHRSGKGKEDGGKGVGQVWDGTVMEGGKKRNTPGLVQP